MATVLNRTIPVFPFTTVPVDETTTPCLPKVWARLEEQGFHPDLLIRIKRFAAYCERWQPVLDLGAATPGPGQEHFQKAAAANREGMSEFLTVLGESFLTPFSPSRFWPKPDDVYRNIKIRYLTALEQLSAKYGNRIPALVWDGLACWGARNNPHEYKTILSEAGFLEEMGVPWIYVDSVLHSLPLVYGLWFDVSTDIFKATGMVVEHNCDCGGCIQPATEEGSIRIPLPKHRWNEATMALLSHLMSQFWLLAVGQLPGAMGVSPETAEIVGLEPWALHDDPLSHLI